MQEETEPMSEDEASDSEIILVDQSPPRLSNREQRMRERKSKVVTEEMKIDQQLKVLGLYEEGMSIEQKEELLAVLAVSRETAEQEETMRRKTKEWEKHLYFSDEGEEMGYESYEQRWRSNRSNAGLPSPSSSDHTKSPPCISEDDIRTKNLSAFKKGEESPSKSKPLIGSVEMLNIDEDTQPVGSQELFVNSSQSKELSSYKSDSEPSLHIQQVQNSEMSEDGKERKQVARRGRRRLSRSACQTSSSSRIAVAHPILRNSSGTGEGESDQENQMDFRKQKLDLDRNMAFWRPCSSPVAPSLNYTRKAEELKENVPYFCPETSTPQECIYSILKSLRDYHLKLPKVQKKARHFIPWGDPVVVGRHHSGTLDVMKRSCQGRRNSGDANRMSDSMLQLARYHSTANEVEYPETDNDCDNLTLPDLDKWPQSSSDMECKSIVRTVKSAFRPIKTPVKKENHCIEETIASDISQNESGNQEALQQNIGNHSVPADRIYEEKEPLENESHGNNHLGQQMSDVDDQYTEQVRNKDAERSPPRISLWSPFQQTDYRLPSAIPDNYKNTEGYLDIGENGKTVAGESTEYVNSNTDKFERQVNITEVDDKNTDLFVRKDGQRTYASRHQLKQQNNSNIFGELTQVTEIPESQESSDMKNETHENESSSNPLTTVEEGNVEQKNTTADKVEQDANKRKRKCDVSKISSDSSKNDSPRKRSCHAPVDKPVSVGNT